MKTSSYKETVPHCLNSQDKSSKKILILSDFHTGHKYGLAHTEHCVNNLQKTAYNFFEEGIKKYGPYDVCFCNGDLIDGTGWRNGGKDLITTDLEEQADMAIKILRRVQFLNKKTPLKFFFTRGTPYHTGESVDFENLIARDFRDGDKKNIDEKLLIKVSGVTFDLKHKISSGSLPHTRSSAPARDIVFAIIKESIENRAKADVFIRSHVHYYNLVESMGRLAITTPCLQMGSSYGDRQCCGLIDFGFLVMEVNKGEIVKITKHISKTPMKKEMVIEI